MTFIPSVLAAAVALSCSTSQATPAAGDGDAGGGDAPVSLKFAGFFRHPVGPRGLEVGDALRAADGRRVRLVGYMVAQELPTPGSFMLTPRPVRMSEHADGDADDLPPATVKVLLDATEQGVVLPHQPGLIALTGRLEVGRAEDASGRVSWVRLHLEPQAAVSTSASIPASTSDQPPTRPSATP